MKMVLGNKDLFYNEISQGSAGTEEALGNEFDHTSIKAKMWTKMWDAWTKRLACNEINYTPTKEKIDDQGCKMFLTKQTH